ncbi:unnamed protein product [Adineta steineri]|uniref:Uncharacterized protein n=1 Tax=Adineta steineri TaxID=433720 RepID=A0A814AC24_9BILA|nr:unnamed protein product [Adineta steineri]CAF1352832.1 unnamed protein product [Adineta steineri]CAF1353824.1 unnamed protein product [Adineta steineri]
MGTRRPVKENDIFVVTANTGDIEFIVVKVDPSLYCTIGPNTNVHYENDSIEREEMEVLLNAIGYKDIGAVKKQLTQIKKMVEVPLKHPRLFEAICIKSPPRSILVVGTPGIGKFSIARATANRNIFLSSTFCLS